MVMKSESPLFSPLLVRKITMGVIDMASNAEISTKLIISDAAFMPANIITRQAPPIRNLRIGLIW